jgi:hypothetical protein
MNDDYKRKKNQNKSKKKKYSLYFKTKRYQDDIK